MITSRYLGWVASPLVENRMLARAKTLGLSMILILTSVSCEIDTKLRMEEGDLPKMILSGNGTLSRLMISGHKTLRKKEGPDSSAVWNIEMTDYDHGQLVSRVGPITYGRIPKGYIQIYPEQGRPLNWMRTLHTISKWIPGTPTVQADTL
jgi:hypothetical protein